MCISETAMRKCYKVKQQSFQTRSSKCSFGLQLGTGRRRGWHLLGLGDAWLSIISCEERYRLDRCFMKISWLYKKWFPLEYENPSDGDFLCDCKKRNSCRITIGKSRLITIFGGQFPFIWSKIFAWVNSIFSFRIFPWPPKWRCSQRNFSQFLRSENSDNLFEIFEVV